MKKISFTFPTYDAMWQFKDQSKAINISVIPMQHTITGMFCNEEVDIAIKEYRAIPNDENLSQMARKAS